MRLGIAHDFGIYDDPRAWSELLGGLGVRATVFPLDYTADPGLIREYAAAAKEKDIMIAEVGGWSNTLSPDPDVKKAAIEKCIGQLRLAEELGARCCVNITGAKGEVWDGPYPGNYAPETWDEAVEMIQTIIDAVQPKNTHYTIEPMPWMIPWDPDQYLRLVQAVDRSAFGVHMDIINWMNTPKKHLFNRELMEEAFSKLGKYTRSVHIKNSRLHGELTMSILECPLDEGTLDLEHYTALAEATDPEMPVLIEHLHSNEEYIAAWQYLTRRLGVR